MGDTLAGEPAEPVHELGEGTPDQVIAEARQRVLGAGGGSDQVEGGEVDDQSDIIDLDADVDPGRPSSAGSPRPASGPDASDDESISDVDRVLSEPAIEPQNEDALSRLVREAMQRAVESARGGESN